MFRSMTNFRVLARFKQGTAGVSHHEARTMDGRDDRCSYS